MSFFQRTKLDNAAGTTINPATSENQVATDPGRDELQILLRHLLMAIRDPNWLEMNSNALRTLLITGSTTAVTGTLTGVTTVTTVTTVANQTNIGGNSADQIVYNLSTEAWATSVRGLMI